MLHADNLYKYMQTHFISQHIYGNNFSEISKQKKDNKNWNIDHWLNNHVANDPEKDAVKYKLYLWCSFNNKKNWENKGNVLNLYIHNFW